MAPNATLPKDASTTTLPNPPTAAPAMPAGPGARPLPPMDDTVSVSGTSTTSSANGAGGRRRRNRNRNRNNNNKQQVNQKGNLPAPNILPRLADSKPVRLQLGLNLDVELELKARLQGDVSLTLL